MRLIFSRKGRTTCKTKIPSPSSQVFAPSFENVGRTLEPSFINKCDERKRYGSTVPYIRVYIQRPYHIYGRPYHIYGTTVPYKYGLTVPHVRQKYCKGFTVYLIRTRRLNDVYWFYNGVPFIKYGTPSSVLKAFCGYDSAVELPCYGDKTGTFL